MKSSPRGYRRIVRAEPLWRVSSLSVIASGFVCGCGGWEASREPLTFGQLTDSRDGHVYRTVMVGGMNWMRDDLDFETPRSICPPSDTTCLLRLYAWSDAMGIDSKFDSTYSGSSNSVVATEGVCPPHWHVPNESEWRQLIQLLYAHNAEGAEFNLRGWTSMDKDETDGHYWTAVEVDSVSAKYAPFYVKSNPYSGYSSSIWIAPTAAKKSISKAVRCLQD